MEYRISLNVGDFWNDGHGRYESFHYKTNCSRSVILTGYTSATAYTGLNPIEDFFRDYDDHCVSQETLTKLRELGLIPEHLWQEAMQYGFNGVGFMPEDYAELFLNFIKLAIPSFQWEPQTTKSIEIGGYGLFSG
jgi:hypothetical protein